MGRSPISPLERSPTCFHNGYAKGCPTRGLQSRNVAASNFEIDPRECRTVLRLLHRRPN
jgi:hypothetical protein